MRINRKKIRELLEILDQTKEEFFKGNKLKEYPFTEWERKRELVRNRLKRLPELVEEAASKVKVHKEKGRKRKIDLSQRTMLFLFARLFGKSNRDMELMITLLKPLFSIDVSYKTIERLYSDEEVKACLYNLFVLLVKEEGNSGNCAGDGTGYGLSITKHYRSEVKKKSKDFRYMFRIIDLDTNFCIGFGYSNYSEKEAFEKAISMVKDLDLELNSLRLDKYYSSKKVIRMFNKEVTLYLLPKRNLCRSGLSWYRILKRILIDPISFLESYYKRNLCESSFSSDKRRFGWRIRQRRDERIEQVIFAISVLHNLFAIRVN